MFISAVETFEKVGRQMADRSRLPYEWDEQPYPHRAPDYGRYSPPRPVYGPPWPPPYGPPVPEALRRELSEAKARTVARGPDPHAAEDHSATGHGAEEDADGGRAADHVDPESGKERERAETPPD